MNRFAGVLALAAGLATSCANGPAPDGDLPAHDRLDIRSVKFLKANSPEFIVFAVTASYTLDSSAEGNVALALDLEPGRSTLVSEQRVRRGAGTVELMAECKRTGRTLQAVSVNLSEYPGGLLRRTLASQIRSVALADAP